jgi:MFS family permease
MRTQPASITTDRFPSLTLAWAVWGLGSVLYLIGFFQRVAPAVMGDELSRACDLSAASLGNLSAFYFYSYVAMQIPTGLLADRWGPRRLLSLGAVVAAVGTLVFAVAPNGNIAGVGRLLVGGSVAVAFVGMLKLASHWLPLRQYAMATGLALFAGICGAVFAGVPLQMSVAAIGWRQVMVVMAIFTGLLAVCIWWLVRDDPVERGYLSHAPEHSESSVQFGVWTGLRKVMAYRNTWLLALVPGGVVGCLLTFAGLWGVPFLTSQYGLTTVGAAAVTSALMVAWALGGPVFGAFSDRIGARKMPYVAGVWLVLIGWLVVVYVPGLPVWLLVLVLVVVGFFSGCMIVGFAFAKESVPISLAGTVSGVVNSGVMSGPMLLQPAVGWMLDRMWQGQEQAGVRVYDLPAYQAGFNLMLAWASLAALLILFSRDTHCRQTQ